VSAIDESGNESAMSREVRSSAGLHLRAFVTRSSGARWVTLEWAGPETATVDVWRNGVHVSTTANDSTWTDEAPGDGGVYEVCEGGTNECTNAARIALTDRRRGTRP
jgi:hypothetical protein